MLARSQLLKLSFLPIILATFYPSFNFFMFLSSYHISFRLPTLKAPYTLPLPTNLHTLYIHIILNSILKKRLKNNLGIQFILDKIMLTNSTLCLSLHLNCKSQLFCFKTKISLWALQLFKITHAFIASYILLPKAITHSILINNAVLALLFQKSINL